MHKAKEGRLMDWVGCHTGNKTKHPRKLGKPKQTSHASLFGIQTRWCYYLCRCNSVGCVYEPTLKMGKLRQRKETQLPRVMEPHKLPAAEHWLSRISQACVSPHNKTPCSASRKQLNSRGGNLLVLPLGVV